jgi:hypothetical protein
MDGLAIVGRAEDLGAAWLWLEATLIGCLGQEKGRTAAQSCPTLVGLFLWEWALETAAEA